MVPIDIALPMNTPPIIRNHWKVIEDGGGFGTLNLINSVGCTNY